MTLEIAAGTAQKIRRLKDQCLLRIVRSEDPGLAAEVFERWRRTTLASASGSAGSSVNFVSEVMRTPDGPLVLMDAKGLGGTDLDRVIDDLVDVAAELGLTSGMFEVPSTGRLVNDLPLVDRGIVGAALPPSVDGRSPEVLPDLWRRIACDWVREPRREPLVAEIVSVEARLGWDALDTYVASSGPWGFRVSSGSVKEGVHTAAGVMPVATRLALMDAGLSYERDDMLLGGEHLRTTIRRCTPEAAYVYVSPVDKVSQFGGGRFDVPGRPTDHPGAISGYLMYLSDIQVLDAFWYQMLGPGHLDRLGSLPGAVEVGDGKVELVLGEPGDWLDPERARALRERGRSLLEPCFIGKAEGRALISERRTAARRE